jgi:uncharacterized membrane protein
MTFILFIAVVFLFISVQSISGRVLKLERRIKEIETEGVQVIASHMTEPQAVVVPEMVQVEESPKLYTDFPSNTAPKEELTDEEVGGRMLGKIGVVAVLIGVAFFIKYAFDHNWVGPVGRVMVGVIIGALAISLGKMLRSRYENYSDVLMGGGLGILYLSTYAAFIFYGLFGAPIAYMLLMCITGLSVVLSIVYNAKPLAIVGLLCGFLVPVLVSVTTPTFAELLTYVLILDVGVAMVSYTYKWITLNHIAFVGTMGAFIVSAAQHVDQVSPGYKAISIAFYSYAFVYFLIFLVASVLHHIVRKEHSTSDDVVFVAMNGLSHGLLGYMLLNPIYPGLMGYFMLFLAIIYSIVAYVSFVSNREDVVLNKFLAGMAALFVTVAIPLHFDGIWISMFWFIEAIVFYVVDKNLKGQNLYTYGAIVYVFGLLQVFGHIGTLDFTKLSVFINPAFGLYLVAVITAYILVWLLQEELERSGAQEIKSLQAMYLTIAQVITLIAVTAEINRYYTYRIQDGHLVYNERNTAVSIFWMLYAMALLFVGFVKQIRFLRIFGLVLFAITALKLFLEIFMMGQLYAIISSITLGVLALMGSFAYAKYSERLKKLL